MLVLSSLLFQIPAAYAYHRGLYPWAAVSFLTSAFSVNYWRHATPSWRKVADVCWARGAGTAFFVLGMHRTRLWSVSGLLVILACYRQSGIEHERNGPWRVYHAAFHLFAALGQLAAIHLI